MKLVPPVPDGAMQSWHLLITGHPNPVIVFGKTIEEADRSVQDYLKRTYYQKVDYALATIVARGEYINPTQDGD